MATDKVRTTIAYEVVTEPSSIVAGLSATWNATSSVVFVDASQVRKYDLIILDSDTQTFEVTDISGNTVTIDPAGKIIPSSAGAQPTTRKMFRPTERHYSSPTVRVAQTIRNVRTYPGGSASKKDWALFDTNEDFII